MYVLLVLVILEILFGRNKFKPKAKPKNEIFFVFEAKKGSQCDIDVEFVVFDFTNASM